MALCVTVVFSPNARVVREVSLTLEDGSCVAHALEASGLVGTGSGRAGATSPVGVWGRLADAGQKLRDLDRVEIYRPLTVDPKLARRARFVRQGARTTGLFARKRPGAKAGY